MKNFTSYSYKALVVLLLIPFLNSCSTQTALNSNKLDVEGTAAVTAPEQTAEPTAVAIEVKTSEVEINEKAKIAEKEVVEPKFVREKFGSDAAIAAKNPKGYKAAKKVAKVGSTIAFANPLTKKALKKADKIAQKITKKQGISNAGSATQEGGLLYVGIVLLIAGILVGIFYGRLGYALSAVGVVLIILWVLLALI